MTQNPQDNPEFVPDGEAGGDGPEAPIFDIPDDPSSLIDMESPVEVPMEGAPVGRGASDEVTELKQLVGERTADLQRLQAEYVNYKRRVDRDRDVAKQKGIESVMLDLLPVLDSIEAAKQHDSVDGGFQLVVNELEKVGTKYGLVLYGEPGEEFDPNLHEALMQMPYEGDHTVTVIAAVMQKGVKLGDRVIRPARVGVADPS